jgi:alkanesulfonate monooxygenase SsuD/methylene tetrahydromethanopterin reductase-like flavin-dependent oxidoreductase (luciferase family)
MDRFWEALDFIVKAMTTHDEIFNWEGEFFHYRQVNVWPRVWQEPHPPIWTTTGNISQAYVLGERGYVMATLGSGYNTRPLYDAYRKGYISKGRPAPGADRFAYLGLVAVADDETEARRRGELVAGICAQARSCTSRSAIRRASFRSRTTPDCCGARHRRAASPKTTGRSTCDPPALRN